MRILMVGAGATGGFYGGMLVRAGRDVTFLLRGQRASEIRERGLEIVSPDESFTVHPPVVTADELGAASGFDLILLSTKAYQLEGAMDDVAPAIGPETVIMPILNGMRQLDILSARFGAERVLGGSVRVAADRDEQGRIHNMSSLDEMNYGELSGQRTARVEAIDREMRDAGFRAILQPDIVDTMWQKWWVLASIGAICTLADGTIGQCASVPHGQEMARAILEESTAITAANGHPPQQQLYRQYQELCTDRNSALTSSMYRDMKKGAPVEADHILGDLLERRKDGAAPLLTAAYVRLKVYEGNRGGQRD